ncbi:glycosyltransferase family A protein [Paraflavitalea sp. CAU 1676]|uniref:glycosyltransferase family 2 protein n=1 Tax=Paraflavitalea sp. CAU 1676 TaxID=3032598 RepID=UPI0023DC9017|nr:glycosyltransferase family A protein [Paraflavitalea sp. CAU 1676]MDF2188769.1 glycosyltransferase family A protein [Paraflavitalea sp. CAU 1676]
MKISPKLTVVIPTIQRPDTLYWTIKTVIEQQYENFAVIVSDNFSNDNTLEVVNSFSDPRITYINPGMRLSMSRHWEFALEHVHEGFVTILGDDDGLIPGALATAASLLSKHAVEAIGWRFGNYNWPGLNPHFMIPMGNYYRIVDSKQEIQKIFSKSIIHSIQFPSLYGGFISIELIRKLKADFGGQFFHSRIPDFYSSSVVAASTKKYIRLEFPLSINATSKHSTGYATVNAKVDQKAINDLKLNKDNLPFHSSIVFLKSINIAIADALLQAHDKIPSFPAPDIKKVIANTLYEAQHCGNEDKYNELIEGIIQIAEKNHLLPYAKDLITKAPFLQHFEAGVKNKYSPISETIYLDTRELNIRNVYDACQVVKRTILPHHFRYSNGIQKIISRIQQVIRYIYLRKTFFPSLHMSTVDKKS